MSLPAEWDRLLRALERDLAQRQVGAAPASEADESWNELRQIVERTSRFYAPREDIDDLVQNVLVKLQSADTLRRLRAARAPEGYLVVMVRNAATDLIRRRGVQAEVPVGSTDQVPVWADSVLERLNRVEEVERLRKAVAELSDADRLLLRMRFWDDLSIAEIARQFDTPYSTVAVRLFRLLRKLRTELGPG